MTPTISRSRGSGSRRLALLEARIRGVYQVLLARGPRSAAEAERMIGELIPHRERAKLEASMEQVRATFLGGKLPEVESTYGAPPEGGAGVDYDPNDDL